jgi:hypothetical protein
MNGEYLNRDLKFVVMGNEKLEGLPALVTFPNEVLHTDVSIKNYEPIAAGFIDMEKRVCHGKSKSLKLHSGHPISTELFHKMLKRI